MPWPKGKPRLPEHKPPRRKKGVPNKLTRAAKAFLLRLVEDPDVQDAIEERIKQGDAVAFFRALEHVIGKPAQRSDVNLSGQVGSRVEVVWVGWERPQNAPDHELLSVAPRSKAAVARPDALRASDGG